MDQNQPNTYQDDEITLKELILKIREYWRELWKNWLLIGLITLPFMAYKLYDAFTTPVVYPASLTFMVDEDEGSGLAGMSNILGQIGIGGIRRGKYNLDRILEISKSRRVLKMALFAQSKLEGETDFLANHLIRRIDLHKAWADDTTGLKDFLYTKDKEDSFTAVEYKVLKTLQGLLNGNEKKEGIYHTSYNEDTGIMTLKIESPAEQLSIALVDTIYATLTKYYVESSTEKAAGTYNLMKEKTDSLAEALTAAEYNLASFVDRNQNIYSAREGSLPRTRMMTQVKRLQVMHAEALKNLEFADFSLKNKTPFITLIDSPVPPISPESQSLIKAAIVGMLLGLMIGITVVLGRKIYRDAMAT